jgi:hypothetical protein
MHVGADFPPVSEEDADAVAPPFERAPEAAREPAPAAAPAAAAPPSPASEPHEPPKRRSTVREPIAAEGTPAPAPTLPPPAPVISSTTGEETATPKRGWWGRRLLGDKD